MNKQITRKQRRKNTNEREHIVNTKFAMKRLVPLTDNQDKLFAAYAAGNNISNLGSAGTGKTYVSLYLALQDVLEKKQYKKILIIRSAVQGREQGFMPGSPTEKLAHYEGPYIDITNDLFERKDAYSVLKQQGLIDFTSTTFIRGLTWDNTIVIVDEVQNMNYEELRTVITRVGENSKIIFCGDTRQDDLRNSKNRSDRSGLVNFMKVLNEMDSFSKIQFTTDDIVRSGICRDFIISEEEVLDYA